MSLYHKRLDRLVNILQDAIAEAVKNAANNLIHTAARNNAEFSQQYKYYLSMWDLDLPHHYFLAFTNLSDEAWQEITEKLGIGIDSTHYYFGWNPETVKIPAAKIDDGADVRHDFQLIIQRLNRVLYNTTGFVDVTIEPIGHRARQNRDLLSTIVDDLKRAYPKLAITLEWPDNEPYVYHIVGPNPNASHADLQGIIIQEIEKTQAKNENVYYLAPAMSCYLKTLARQKNDPWLADLEQRGITLIFDEDVPQYDCFVWKPTPEQIAQQKIKEEENEALILHHAHLFRKRINKVLQKVIASDPTDPAYSFTVEMYPEMATLPRDIIHAINREITTSNLRVIRFDQNTTPPILEMYYRHTL